MKRKEIFIILFSLILLVSLYAVSRQLLIINPIECTMCGRCMLVCPNNAIIYDEDLQVLQIDRNLCNDCGLCLEECVHGALEEDDGSAFFFGIVISSESGFPISNSTIMVDSLLEYSQFDGSYGFKLDSGIYDISCNAEGYISEYIADLSLEAGEMIRHDFILTPEENSMSDDYLQKETFFSPNPFKTSTHLCLNQERLSKIKSANIYNVKGQHVCALNLKFPIWHGEDNSGNTVSEGLYFYVINTGKSIRTGKLIYLK